MIKKACRILAIALSILVGLYPSIYFIIDRKFGLLNSKSEEVLTHVLWNAAFYVHIIFGGIALLTGWTQFGEAFRNRHLQRHRQIGKLYVGSVLLSSIAGIYIGFFATGGIIASLGFICLGILWFYVTLMAFLMVKKQRIYDHKRFMIYSYALCFAAVTLRIWLPILTFACGDFTTGYVLASWVCWLPNLLLGILYTRHSPSHLIRT
ncbi:MAG: DUF2306 domain-containing protein [Bacteroidia bacterium]|nr:DUF2306 domain-containing protein [Bacteroidia bacterium]